MKTMIVVGGGPEQLPIIERLQQQGFTVVLFDGNPNAMGKSLVKHFHAISTRDYAAIIQVLQEKYAEFELVGCTYMITEACLETVYRVAQAFNFASTTFESVRSTQSKTYLREFLQTHQLANIPFMKINKVEQLKEGFFSKNGKVIVKPTDAGGQVGLHIIDSFDQAESLVKDALNHSFSGECILEKFIDGDEINGVFVVVDGQVQDLLLSDRVHEPNVFGVVKQHRFPSQYKSLNTKIEGFCQQLIDALQIENGIFFPQFLVDSTGFYLCEIGERIPGGVMMELYRYATGIDLINLQIDISAKQVQPLSHYRTQSANPAVVVDFTNCVNNESHLPCLIEGVLGIESADFSSESYEFGFYSYSREGMPQARKLEAGGDRFFYLVVGGSSLQVIDQELKKVKAKMRFKSNQGVIFSC